MKEPNFFIIGAPKAGTTSLASWLASHPRIYMCPVKEPHFFSTDFNRGDINSLKEYEELFKNAEEYHLAVGEASTEYLYSDNAVLEIERVYPRSRYIVMIRNPVDMVYSLYNYEKEGGREILDTFEEAWRKSPERRQGQWVNRWCTDPKWLDYQKVALLGDQLKRLFECVDKERVLVLVLDYVKADPRKEYLKVIEFLGVEDDGRTIFEPENTAKKNKWEILNRIIQIVGGASRTIKKRTGVPVYKGTGILGVIERVNSAYSRSERLSSDMRAQLSEYFYQDVELLSSILGRDLLGWLTLHNELGCGDGE